MRAALAVLSPAHVPAAFLVETTAGLRWGALCRACGWYDRAVYTERRVAFLAAFGHARGS